MLHKRGGERIKEKWMEFLIKKSDSQSDKTKILSEICDKCSGETSDKDNKTAYINRKELPIIFWNSMKRIYDTQPQGSLKQNVTKGGKGGRGGGVGTKILDRITNKHAAIYL